MLNCKQAIVILAAAGLLINLAFAQGITDTKKGQGGSEVQGSAGTGGSLGDEGLEHCDKPMGAMAVVEPQDFVIEALRRYDLKSPVGLIRMIIQQSNCFIVVERGKGMRNMMQERALMESGDLREDSNMGGGQMVAADFLLTPEVVFSDDDAGSVGGALGGAIGNVFGGRAGSVIGGVAGGVRFREAQTSMLVSDARSGVQVAAAEGSAKKADLALGGLLAGGNAVGALGGYQSTDEGKMIAASFADNYNNIVRVIRNDPALVREVGSLPDEAAAGGTAAPGAVFAVGDVLRAKIDNVKIFSEPNSAAPVVTSLAKNEEVVFMGEELEGYVQVESGSGGGWVRKVLVQR